MYLNVETSKLVLVAIGLTVTWDVFKYIFCPHIVSIIKRLTVTWDVFKSLIQYVI